MQNVKALITTQGELLVSPRWDLEVTPGYVYLEFVDNADIDTLNSIQISTDAPVIYKQDLHNDGLYIYHRMQVLTRSYIEDEAVPYDNLFYYDDLEKPGLYCDGEEVTTNQQLLKIVKDNEGSLAGIIDYISYPIFSLSRIQKCLSEYQRKFIFEHNGKDIKYCNDNKTDKFNRDFLFSTVFVLRQLIKEQRYEEATRILQTVNNCSSICKDVYSKKGCCCR